MSGMINRHLLIVGFVTLVATTLDSGCSKPPGTLPESSAAQDKGLAMELVAKAHWIGKERLAADSGATNLLAIWNLPESSKLGDQTLEKLAATPWKFFPAATPASNATVSFFRAMLEDIVRSESYLELRAATNGGGQLAWAVRLDDERARLWQKNLPIVLESLGGARTARTTGTPTSSFDYTIRNTSPTRGNPSDFRVTFTRAGEWILLALTRDTARQAGEGKLLSSFIRHIQDRHVPYKKSDTNYWATLEVDPKGISDALALGWRLPELTPRVSLTLVGEAGALRTRAELKFQQPLLLELEPWNVPTNLIHDPLIGFAAVRGMRPLLASSGYWNEARFGLPPNQACFWSQNGSAPLHFFAIPTTNASNQFRLISDALIQDVNPAMAAHATVFHTPMGKFEKQANAQRVRWRGVPLISPNLEVESVGGNSFITGGLFANVRTNSPMPEELLKQFRTDSNLLFYDWEITGPVEYRLIQVSQIGRFVFGRSRLSMTNNAALPWLVAISGKLGNSGTSIRRADEHTLTLSRLSTIGLTAFELHLLTEWLESPKFPIGLFTLDSGLRAPVPEDITNRPKAH